MNEEPLRRFRISKKNVRLRGIEKSMEEKLAGPWPSQISVSQCLDHRHISVSESETGHSAGSYLWLREPTQIFARTTPDICENQTKIFARTKPNIWRNFLSQGSLFSRTSRWPWCWSDYDERLTVQWPLSLRKWLKPFLQCTVSLQWGYSEATVRLQWARSGQFPFQFCTFTFDGEGGQTNKQPKSVTFLSV